MANIKKFQVWFDHKWHEVDITFSIKTSKFTASLPDRIREITGKNLIREESLPRLERQIKRMAELAEAKSQKGRKVIVFSFTYEGKRRDPKTKKLILDAYGYENTDGLTLKMWWKVAMERTDHEKEKHYYEQTAKDLKAGKDIYTHNLNVSRHEEHQAIPWSEEREKFFQSLDDSMVQVIQRLIKFANTSPKKIAQAIDAGQVPLLGKGKG